MTGENVLRVGSTSHADATRQRARLALAPRARITVAAKKTPEFPETSEIPHGCLDLRCLDLRCLDSRRTSRTKGGRPTSNIEVMFCSFEDYNAIRMSEFRGLNVFIEISV